MVYFVFDLCNYKMRKKIIRRRVIMGKEREKMREIVSKKGVNAYKEVLGFFKDRYGRLGKEVAEDLMLSLISLRCERLVKKKGLGGYIRYRRHIMLCWDVGRGKSTFLKIFKNAIPEEIFDANILSESSPEALRGGISKEGGFVPPEFRVSDIVILPELSSLLKTNEDVGFFNMLLTCLEDGEFRLKLLKLGNVTENVKKIASGYGVEFRDGSMIFDSDAIMWIATHDIDTIPMKLKKAVLDRFFIKRLSVKDFDMRWLRKVRGGKEISEEDIKELKEKITEVLESVYVDERMIKIVKDNVTELIDDYLGRRNITWDERVHLRFTGELDRVGIADMSIRDYKREGKLCINGGTLSLLRKKFDELLGAGRTPYTHIYDLVIGSKRDGMTVSEIMEITGYNKMRIARNLSMLGSMGIKKIRITKEMRNGFGKRNKDKRRNVKYLFIHEGN